MIISFCGKGYIWWPHSFCDTWPIFRLNYKTTALLVAPGKPQASQSCDVIVAMPFQTPVLAHALQDDKLP